MEAVVGRINEIRDQLEFGTSEADFDRFLKGMARAYREVLAVKVDQTPDLINIEKAGEDE